jgi:hypothetical protein
MTRVFRCRRDRIDNHDFTFGVASHVALPDHYDPRSPSDTILDQGEIGSCVLNARAVIIERLMRGYWDARLAAYYWARFLEHTTRIDAGCMPRDALKVLTKYGSVPEAEYPYDISKFRRKPSAKITAAAKTRETGWAYHRVTSLDAALAACAAGHDVLLGLRLYPGFESDAALKTGEVPMPSADEEEIGGHGMAMRGFTSLTGSRRAIVQNSWGPTDGDHGHRYFPLSYIASPKLCPDKWVLTRA